MTNLSDNLLKVEDLSVIYGSGCPLCIQHTGPEYGSNICDACGSIVACAEISFAVDQGEILGIVGESGSGKSTIVRSLYFDIAAAGGSIFP